MKCKNPKCKKTINPTKSQRKRGRGKYCSNKCRYQDKNLGKNYRKKAFTNLEHKCKYCGYSEHASVLEVHHIDKDRTNNNLNNLELVCPTCHVLIHKNLMGW